jgi:hypothetical protein
MQLSRDRFRLDAIVFTSGVNSNENVITFLPNIRFSFLLANCAHAREPLHKYYKGPRMPMLRWKQI